MDTPGQQFNHVLEMEFDQLDHVGTNAHLVIWWTYPEKKLLYRQNVQITDRKEHQSTDKPVIPCSIILVRIFIYFSGFFMRPRRCLRGLFHRGPVFALAEGHCYTQIVG